jgi:proteasome lid subunit RPN8/RPN11
MRLQILPAVLERIQSQGEAAYPEEGAGLMLGEISQDLRQVTEILTLPNVREDTARHNRYLLSPEDYLKGEAEASRLSLDVLGVFHSHPDHPNQPSEFDRQWAWPNFSYLITSVMMGKALDSRAWRLTEDRAKFIEEEIEIVENSID